MFDYTKNELAEKAKELNFVRDTLEKVLRLSDILSFLNESALPKSYLVLKGGTAINLAVFSLPRLSVDIDLDFSQNLPREEMMSAREKVTDAVKVYMAGQGYNLSPASKYYHSLDSFVFTYVNLGGVKDNIKIEINYSLRAHIFEPSQRKMFAPELNNGKLITTLAPTELFAAKINALLGRAAARDLYDIHNMIAFRVFDEAEYSLLRKCVVFYTAVSQEKISPDYSFERLNAITVRKIKTDLLPVIKRGEFFELEAVKKEVESFLRSLLTLTPEEHAFLELFARKEYHPELLFDDSDVLNRIADHPMVKWKMQEH